MRKSYRWFRVAAMVIMFVGGGSLMAMSNVAEATPLGAGDYVATSGAMIGSTFSIDTSGLFSAWNLSFPTLPPTIFVSLSPSPTINSLDFGGSLLVLEPSPPFPPFLSYYFYTGHNLDVGSGFGDLYGWGIRDTRDLFIAGGDGVVALSSALPEPPSIILIAIGLLGLAGYRWSQRRREGLQVG